MKWACLLLALVGAVMLSAAAVLADGDMYVVVGGGGVGTKISRLPYTINAPGFYYVTGNLTCPSGNGITVNADDVTIDLMGFCLNGIANSFGIYMNGRKNVEIRNGTLRGWWHGIHEDLPSGINHRVINLRVESCLTGVYLNGYCDLVKGCMVLDNSDRGISVGNGSIVSGNQAYNSYNGIVTGGTTINNVVSNCTYGILSGGTTSFNTVINCGTGIYTGSGSIIGNTVDCQSGQTGILLFCLSPGCILLDQNTVTGGGTHSSSSGDGTIVWGKNAGLP